MNVINEWDGAAQTPTQVIRNWYAAYKEEMYWGGIDGFHATELMSALAPLFAAGPWRTDVENAPEKQTIMGGFYDSYNAFFWYPVSRIGNTWVPDKPIAFATINQPEIQG